MEYNYPLDYHWSTEEIIDVIALYNAVEKAYEVGISKEEFMNSYRKFKLIVDSKSEEKSLDKQFYEISHYSIYQVVKAAKETGKVVTVEEHSVIGGLGGAVAEVLAEKAPTKMLRIGINDVFGESGPAVKLLEKYGIDANGIYAKVKAFV